MPLFISSAFSSGISCRWSRNIMLTVTACAFQSLKHCDRLLSSTGSDDKTAILYGLVITALFFIRTHSVIYRREVLLGINDPELCRSCLAYSTSRRKLEGYRSNKSPFFPSQGPAAASKDSSRTPHQNTHIQTHTKTSWKTTQLALATVLKFSIYYVDRVSLSLDDGVEIRTIFSPPLMFIFGTLYRTVDCSILNFARFPNHRDLILLCLYQIYPITDCYTSSNCPSPPAVFLSWRFMSRV